MRNESAVLRLALPLRSPCPFPHAVLPNANRADSPSNQTRLGGPEVTGQNFILCEHLSIPLKLFIGRVYCILMCSIKVNGLIQFALVRISMQ